MSWKKHLATAQEHARRAQEIAAKGTGPGGSLTAEQQKQFQTERDAAMREKGLSDTAKKDADDAALLKSLGDVDGDAPEYDDDDDDLSSGAGQGWQRLGGVVKASGSAWSKSVATRLRKASSTHGVKALLTGQIDVPAAVAIVPLPDKPMRLLDLIDKAPHGDHTFSFLRQTVKTQTADVVADNATKPTSTYTFEEVEDRCRVIAHLSEAFPLRYLEDYAELGRILDLQMQVGVIEKLEQQIVAGTGTGEQFQGILTTTGVSAVPFATDKITTIRKARTVLQGKGENPNAWVVNPTDLEELDLLREDGATGGFLMDTAAADTIFGPGIERVPSTAVPAGTAVLADWAQIGILIRQGAHTLAATQAGDLFEKNQVKLRSEGRFGVKLWRPQSFAVVDLTA